MIQKLLHVFVAQETLALIEKINATDSTSDSSFRAAEHLLRHGKFNFVEHRLLAEAIKKVARRETLVGAMNVVVYNNLEGEIKSTGRSKHSPVLQDITTSTRLHDIWNKQLNMTSLQNPTNPYLNSISPYQ
jgi:hypothetical protein